MTHTCYKTEKQLRLTSAVIVSPEVGWKADGGWWPTHSLLVRVRGWPAIQRHAVSSGVQREGMGPVLFKWAHTGHWPFRPHSIGLSSLPPMLVLCYVLTCLLSQFCRLGIGTNSFRGEVWPVSRPPPFGGSHKKPWDVELFSCMPR